LEENIITYINTIADIIHTDTNAYYGAANKNIGSAFLLAWKICDGALPGLRDPRDDPNSELVLSQDAHKRARASIQVMQTGCGHVARAINPQELVDSALTAILQMRIHLHHANTSPNGVFRPFCDDPRVQATFGPNFQVHMGFGMHVGWAIEGAIGSKYKIDASYLSPNVNMAARLEAATGQFDVPMLLSEWFVGELSPGARALCRKIDRVTVKGSAIPMDLWTYDMGTYPVSGLLPLVNAEGQQEPVNVEEDARFKEIQEGIDPLFFTTFQDGVRAYLDGDWMDAKRHLTRCHELHATDGPTQLLLRFLGARDFEAPESWPGYRELTEK